MKKYRLTKITVKTREIVSTAKNTAGETKTPICPICHTPVSVLLSAAENCAAESEKRMAMLLPAEISEDRTITE